ncbi:MAG TPA: hypothetical protein VGA56_03930, partial [Opitutaceae bacterium]
MPTQTTIRGSEMNPVHQAIVRRRIVDPQIELGTPASATPASARVERPKLKENSLKHANDRLGSFSVLKAMKAESWMRACAAFATLATAIS